MIDFLSNLDWTAVFIAWGISFIIIMLVTR